MKKNPTQKSFKKIKKLAAQSYPQLKIIFLLGHNC
jgi:hypothetical protein